MLTQAARRREWSLALSLAADSSMCLAYAVVAIGSGSLPMLAETLRGGILAALGWLILAMMRRLHRRQLHAYDYGTGKLEQFSNFLVGGLLLLGAAWVALRSLAAYAAGPPSPDPSLHGWMVAAQVLAAMNVAVNALAFIALWRAGRDGTSLLMRGQVQARAGKLATSLLVCAAVAVAAAWPGTRGAWIANLAGGLVVVVVMAGIGIAMLRQTLPDLLDRALEEDLQRTINATLSAHFDAYDTLEHVRSRQSGQDVHIEITLGFDADRNFGEVATAARRMEQELEARIPGAEVTVVPVDPAAG
jgi:cation diffusion facilitator family transporter